MIQQFEQNYIYDERGKFRKNIKVKNYVDGSRYEGEVVNDKRNGKGIYHYANQDKYIGDWVNDKYSFYFTYFFRFDGQGFYIFKNGERYEG